MGRGVPAPGARRARLRAAGRDQSDPDRAGRQRTGRADHQLDVIAIDGELQVYTSLATDNLQMHPAIKLSTAAPGFLLVRTSVTRAPR
jgi:hypothetical protein